MIESTPLGKWLRALRSQQRLDLSSFAALSGVDRSTINRIERGVAQPTICTAVRLCKGLGVGPVALVSAVQDRQILPDSRTGEAQDEVLLPADIASFVDVARSDSQRARSMLAGWLDSLSTLYNESGANVQPGGHNPDQGISQQFSSSFVDFLLSDIEIFKPEMQFPPITDGKYVLDIYNRGAAITLRDVGAYIRWTRQQQRRSQAELREPAGVTDSALSRIETGALEQIRLIDILGLDLELNAEGTLIWMCWAACDLFPPILRHGVARKPDQDPASVWTEREYRLALTMLAIVRWWHYLQPEDVSMVAKIHRDLDEALRT